tara:strand:- start:3537 stop:3974 length:438 start_codon:yes stop_codon:yes gene_type:complete
MSRSVVKGMRYKATRIADDGEPVNRVHSRARPHPVPYKHYRVYFYGDQTKVFPSYKLYPKPWYAFVGRGTEMIIMRDDLQPVDATDFANVERDLNEEEEDAEEEEGEGEEEEEDEVEEEEEQDDEEEEEEEEDEEDEEEEEEEIE